MMARPWPEMMREPGADRHLVQVYRDPASMARIAGSWAAHALLAGGGCVLITRALNHGRLREVIGGIGADVAAGEGSGALVFIDADDLLAGFLVDGVPRGELFKPLARAVITGVRAALAPGAEVRVFGDMMNLLWQGGQKTAARRLEALWSETIEEERVRLLCAYRVDNLSEVTLTHHLKEICDGHSQLIPEEDVEAFDSAVAAAFVEVFGEELAGVLRARFADVRPLGTTMPRSEAMLMALLDAQPDAGRKVIQAVRRRLAALGGR